jgi:hypothetical protein
MTEEFRSMRSFNPSQPAMVYDELNNEWFEWKPADYAQLYRDRAVNGIPSA